MKDIIENQEALIKSQVLQVKALETLARQQLEMLKTLNELINKL